MFAYIVLLLVTAFVAYLSGSISTRRLASRLLFHRDLARLGRGNVWLSNFHRLFGIPGFIKLGLLEVVKALLPILLGGTLLAIKGKFEAGLAFAGFCVGTDPEFSEKLLKQQLFCAQAFGATGILVVDNEIALRLLIASAALVILRHLPALLRILRGQEPRFSFRRDLTYKLDERF